MKHVSSWSFMKISSYESMFSFSGSGRIFTTCKWFWLFNLFVKFVSLTTCWTPNHMRSVNQVENLSKFTIKLPKSFHYFYFSSYLLVTLHLPWSLADGGSLKVDKMSSTHLNLIPLYVLSSMSQREDMSKNPFWYFWFNRLWPFNFQFGCWPKSSNHKILVSTHPIWKLKIVPKIYRLRESMVKNPFWYFEYFTSGNTCDSSTSPMANFWFVTSEKFFKCGFSVFHLNLPFSFESR